MQVDVIQRKSAAVIPAGYSQRATDWQDDAQQMLMAVSAELTLRHTTDRFAARPAYRPVNKFENHSSKLDHGVWDLVFTKV